VTVVARDSPERTVSAVAGGLWLPYECGPPERVAGWAVATLRELDRLEAEEGAPIAQVEAHLIGAGGFWVAALPAGRVRAPETVPGTVSGAGRGGDGLVARLPLVQTPAYLSWLMARARAMGAFFERRAIASLEELGGPGRVVVNCLGLAAREVAGDDRVEPVRGDVVLVRPLTGVRCVVDLSDPVELAYVLPRPDVCILGGTAVAGDEPDPGAFEAIWERCVALEPALRDAERIGQATGLRPARPEVRVERGTLADGTPVVHDYGHGGGGLTLSWGCADEVADLALAAIGSVP